MWTAVLAAAAALAWAMPGTLRFLPEASSSFWAMVLGALVVDIPLFGLTFRHERRIRATLSVCFALAIFVLWGAAPAIVVQALAGAVSAVGQRYRGRPGLFVVARLVLAVAAAALVVNLVRPDLATQPVMRLTGADLLAFTLLAAVWIAVSYGLLVAARVTTDPYDGRRSAAEIRLDLIRTAVSVMIVAPLLTVIPDWWPVLVAAPLLVLNQLALEQVRHELALSRDPASGLLNYQGLAGGVRAITALDARAAEGPQPFGIILINVESVLHINRTLGRGLYEKVIGAASRRIIDAYGEDYAARIAGDSIVILVPDLFEPHALAVTQNVVGVLEPPVEVDGIPFTLRPVAGVALSPQHGRDLGTLLTRAELAASEARRTGVRAVRYAQHAAELAERRLVLLRELHAALREPTRHNEITVLYQPQVEISSGRVFSVEALLRWTHPQWGSVATDELIEAIEPSDVMYLLTRHVLALAAAQVRRWNEQGEFVRVAVNVSVQDLHEPQFLDVLSELIVENNIARNQLTIEITERMLISDTAYVRQIAERLARLGVGLSLDDFGTGHASLQQLRQIPLSEVKVDRAYVQGMVDNLVDAAIVTSVYKLARALQVDVVAEGVEDERTAVALAKLPGVIGQGWYFGQPMTVDDLQAWRRSRQSSRPKVRGSIP